MSFFTFLSFYFGDVFVEIFMYTALTLMFLSTIVVGLIITIHDKFIWNKGTCRKCNVNYKELYFDKELRVRFLECPKCSYSLRRYERYQ